MLEKFEELIEQEIENRYKDIIADNEKLFEAYTKKSSEWANLLAENKNLKLQKDFTEKFNNIRKMFNIDSLSIMINNRKFEKTKIDLTGMYERDVPKVFKLIVKYYKDRQEILDIMDTFEIDYPQWYRTFKLPFDFNKEELLLVMNNTNKLSMTNSCYFEGYIGFYYKWLQSTNGNLKSSHMYIPFDLLLSNHLLTEDKELFDLLLKEVSKSYGKHEFYHVGEYQKLTYEQKVALGKTLSSKVYRDYVSKFISYASETLSEPKILEMFKDKMNDNQYSSFHYTKFPAKDQKEYLIKIGLEESKGWHDKWRLLEKSTMPLDMKNEVALAFINDSKEETGGL